MTIDRLFRYLHSHHKLALLAFVSALAFTLLTLRMWATQNADFIFMTWNLFLAWVPLLFIKWVSVRENAKPAPALLLLIYLTIWLLFFPNAPYLITDLKHLKSVPDQLLWYDALMIFTFALSGFLTGLYSIRIVHRLLTNRYNQYFAWLSIAAAMFLSGFGIFLGRYGRWNSWDIVTHPKALAKGIFHSMQDPFAIKHTFTFSFVLMLMYFAFHIFAEIKQYDPARKYS